MNYKEHISGWSLKEASASGSGLSFKLVFDEIKTVVFLLLITFLICIMPNMKDLQSGAFQESSVQIAIAKTFHQY